MVVGKRKVLSGPTQLPTECVLSILKTFNQVCTYINIEDYIVVFTLCANLLLYSVYM